MPAPAPTSKRRAPGGTDARSAAYSGSKNVHCVSAKGTGPPAAFIPSSMYSFHRSVMASWSPSAKSGEKARSREGCVNEGQYISPTWNETPDEAGSGGASGPKEDESGARGVCDRRCQGRTGYAGSWNPENVEYNVQAESDRVDSCKPERLSRSEDDRTTHALHPEE